MHFSVDRWLFQQASANVDHERYGRSDIDLIGATLTNEIETDALRTGESRTMQREWFASYRASLF